MLHTASLSSVVQGGSGLERGKLPGLSSKPALALPGLIQGLEGEA